MGSGPNSIYCLKQLLLSNNEPKIKPRYATLKTIYDTKTKEPLDTCIIIYFPKPNSFTGEDLIELHIHGSINIIHDVCKSLDYLNNNPSKVIRPAEAGEFTYRAFINN